MKKLFLVIASVTILFTVHANAKSLPSVATKLPEQLKSEIAKALDFRGFAEQNCVEGEVWLKVCITDESKLNIIDLSATNQEIGTFVKKQISDLYVQEPGCTIDKVYYLKVTFKWIEMK